MVMITVMVSVTWITWRSRAPSRLVREDVNRDGKVDIRDALLLARKLELREPVSPALDINGDGRVDRRDAEAIAVQAVRLDKPRG